MAGKLENICTAFPLTTFLAKNSKWLPLKFSAKNIQTPPRAKSLPSQIKKRPILSKFKFGWNKYLQNRWISCTKWCVYIIRRATWQKKISFSFTEIFQLLDKISNCFTSKLLFLDMLPLIKDLFKSTIFATQEIFSFKKIYPIFETCR